YLNELQEYLAIHHDIPVSITAPHDNFGNIGLTTKIVWQVAAERDEGLHQLPPLPRWQWKSQLDGFKIADMIRKSHTVISTW
ncbi:hypothetical protein K439DRAFT_1341284, partial [Ramaria rubella]